MNRRMTIVLVSVLALVAGACGGAVARVVAPVPVAPAPRVVQIPAPDLPSLPIREFRFSELLVPVAQAAEPEPAPGCDIVAAITGVNSTLASASLAVGDKEYRYREKRAGRWVTFRDPEKQIVLALMNLESCRTRLVPITKRGDVLIAPSGYDIEVVTRTNGIQWNNWATEYRVNEPTGWIVIANAYPYVEHQTTVKLVKGAGGKTVRTYVRTKKITSIVYTGYNQQLHLPQLVNGGAVFLKATAQAVYDELRQAGVMSRAFPDMPLVQVSALKPEYVIRLAPIEQMDLTEFLLDPGWTTERIHVIIGANRSVAASFTCSSAKACGLMQFTPGTYRLMVNTYPAAHLIEDFVTGARNPQNAMKAALLLHDHNLAELMRAFGPAIADEPNLEEYLAAAYNTGVGRVIAVLKAGQSKPVADWTDAKGRTTKQRLLAETKGYIAKLRYLRDQWTATVLTQADLAPDK